MAWPRCFRFFCYKPFGDKLIFRNPLLFLVGPEYILYILIVYTFAVVRNVNCFAGELRIGWVIAQP